MERNSRYSLRKEGLTLVTTIEEPSIFSKEAKEGFPRCVQSQAFLPVHIVRVDFQLNRLPDNSVHVAGYSRKVPGVLEFYKMVVDEHMSCHRRCVWMSKLYVSVVFFFSGLYRSTSLSDVHVTTLTECTVYPH